MVLIEQPPDAHRIRIEDLFVGLQDNDEVAIRPEAFLPIADQIGNEDRCHELVVPYTPSVRIAVLLDQLERIGRPVFWPGVDDVDVGQQQDRFPSARAAEPRDPVALARCGRQDVNVRLREPGNQQTCGHRLRGLQRVARRRHGIDLDKLLVNVARELLRRGERLAADRKWCGKRHPNSAEQRDRVLGKRHGGSSRKDSRRTSIVLDAIRLVTVQSCSKPRSHRRGIVQASLEVLLDTRMIEHALLGDTLVNARCALPGPARAVHTCPLVERGGSSVGGAWGRRPLALGIRPCGRVHWQRCPAAAWGRRRRPPRQRLLPGNIRCESDRLELAVSGRNAALIMRIIARYAWCAGARQVASVGDCSTVNGPLFPVLSRKLATASSRTPGFADPNTTNPKDLPNTAWRTKTSFSAESDHLYSN